MIDIKWERVGKFVDHRGLMVVVEAKIELDGFRTLESPEPKWIEVSRSLQTLAGQPCRPVHKYGNDVEQIDMLEVMTPFGAVLLHKVHE